MASCPLLDKGMLFPILTHSATLILFQLNTKDLGIDEKFTPRAKDQGPTSSLLIIQGRFYVLVAPKDEGVCERAVHLTCEIKVISQEDHQGKKANQAKLSVYSRMCKLNEGRVNNQFR